MKAPEVTEYKHINGLLQIDLSTAYDYRGYNFEGYNHALYATLHPFFKENKFIVDSFSRSSKGVLRGFHGDRVTHKLIQVLFGKIQFVVIDYRLDSDTRGHTAHFYLSADRPCQIMIPAGCVNAHLCLSDECLFSYKLSHEYVPQDEQIHVAWNYGFREWDIKKPILSKRDEIIRVKENML